MSRSQDPRRKLPSQRGAKRTGPIGSILPGDHTEVARDIQRLWLETSRPKAGDPHSWEDVGTDTAGGTGAAGIQFDKYPQDGNWLYVKTAHGNPSSLGGPYRTMYFQSDGMITLESLTANGGIELETQDSEECQINLYAGGEIGLYTSNHNDIGNYSAQDFGVYAKRDGFFSLERDCYIDAGRPTQGKSGDILLTANEASDHYAFGDIWSNCDGADRHTSRGGVRVDVQGKLRNQYWLDQDYAMPDPDPSAAILLTARSDGGTFTLCQNPIYDYGDSLWHKSGAMILHTRGADLKFRLTDFVLNDLGDPFAGGPFPAGHMIMEGLPTTDPDVSGAVWNAGGFLKLSGYAGPSATGIDFNDHFSSDQAGNNARYFDLETNEDSEVVMDTSGIDGRQSHAGFRFTSAAVGGFQVNLANESSFLLEQNGGGALPADYVDARVNPVYLIGAGSPFVLDPPPAAVAAFQFVNNSKANFEFLNTGTGAISLHNTNGSILISTGGGDIVLGSTNIGRLVVISNELIVSGLPTSAPSGAGKVWNSGGTLKIT